MARRLNDRPAALLLDHEEAYAFRAQRVYLLGGVFRGESVPGQKDADTQEWILDAPRWVVRAGSKRAAAAFVADRYAADLARWEFTPRNQRALYCVHADDVVGVRFGKRYPSDVTNAAGRAFPYLEG